MLSAGFPAVRPPGLLGGLRFGDPRSEILRATVPQHRGPSENGAGGRLRLGGLPGLWRPAVAPVPDPPILQGLRPRAPESPATTQPSTEGDIMSMAILGGPVGNQQVVELDDFGVRDLRRGLSAWKYARAQQDPPVAIDPGVARLLALAERLSAVRSGQGRSGTATTPLPRLGGDMPPKMLTKAEAGLRLGLSERTVRRRITDGTLTAHRIGGAVRLRCEDVDNFGARSAVVTIVGADLSAVSDSSTEVSQ
jgi:excisionase family DNA binding protein